MRILVLLFCLINIGCASNKTFLKDNYLELKTSKSAFINDEISFELDEILSDSRCPIDVTCVRAGEVVVKISVYKKSQKVEEINLTIDHKSLEENKLFFEKYNTTSGKKIKQFSVLPKRKSGENIKKQDYILKIVFEE